MVRIPDRPYAHIAESLPDARFAGGIAAGGSALAENLTALGEGAKKLFGAALLLRDQRDHDLLMEAQNRYTKAMTEYSLNAEQTRTGDRARGFTREYGGTSDTTRAEVLDWLKENKGSGLAERAFTNWATGRKTVGGAHAAQFEHKELVAHSKDLFTQRVQLITDQIEQNPRAYKDAVGQLEESFTMAVGQGLFRPEEAKAKLHDAREKLGLAAFENLYAMDRPGAMKSMDFFGMSPAQQGKAKKRYQADLRTEAAQARMLNAEAAENLRYEAQDAAQYAKTTGDASQLFKIAEGFARLGFAKQATHVRTEAGRIEARYGDIQEWNTIPLPELVKQAAALEADLAKPGDPAAHAEKADKLKNLAAVYEGRQKAYRHDPAGAADKFSAGETPEARVSSRLRVQEQNGVPAGGQKALTAAEAANLHELWTNGDLQTRLAIGEQLKQYGQHAALAARDAGIGPAEQLALLQADTPEGMGALKTLTAAAGMKSEQLSKFGTDEQVQRLTRGVLDDSEVAKGYAALAKVLPSVPSVQLIRTGLEKTTEKLLRMTGGDTEQVKKLLDGRMEALTGDNFALIYDSRTFRKGGILEGALRERMEKPLEDFLEGMPAGGKFERQDKLYDLRRRGVWANAPDGRGYVLFDPVAQAPVTDRKGRLFRVTDADIWNDPGAAPSGGEVVLP